MVISSEPLHFPAGLEHPLLPRAVPPRTRHGFRPRPMSWPAWVRVSLIPFSARFTGKPLIDQPLFIFLGVSISCFFSPLLAGNTPY